MGLTGSDVGSKWLAFHAGEARDITMHGLIHLQLQRFIESRQRTQV